MPVPLDALIAGMVQHGLPEPVAQLMASFDAGAGRGDLAATSSAVAELTGAPPRGVREFLLTQRVALG